MKIIHCADLHLGSKINGLPTDLSKVRKAEVVHTFERIAEFANNNGVKAIIIAGDMFDTTRVSDKLYKQLLSCIRRYSNVDFLYLSGNHDEDAFIKKGGKETLPNNFKVFGNEWTCFEYDNVTITGINSCALNTSIVYDTLSLDKDKINICCMHGQIAGYALEKGKEVISLPRLKNKHIDYLALGHYHFFMDGKIDERGFYAYSGCPEGRGYDETGEKGFVLIDTVNNKLSYKFKPFACRNILELEFSVTNFESGFDVREEILSIVKAKYNKNYQLKVVLSGERKADFILDTVELAERLNELVFFAKVVDKTNLKISLEEFATDKSVRGEFVRAVLSSELSQEDKNKVILMGLNALKGEIEE
ncbi:MAG: DNA repair exonuclease [Clostridia bacterium]|nr:DNA repair exonuclease [Clostridia bacterium]